MLTKRRNHMERILNVLKGRNEVEYDEIEDKLGISHDELRKIIDELLEKGLINDDTTREVISLK
jgi:predicted transcriptional regulator